MKPSDMLLVTHLGGGDMCDWWEIECLCDIQGQYWLADDVGSSCWSPFENYEDSTDDWTGPLTYGQAIEEFTRLAELHATSWSDDLDPPIQEDIHRCVQMILNHEAGRQKHTRA